MGTAPGKDKPFLSDIEEIRRRARKHIEQGAVTESYKADLETSIRVLNEALATEIVCVLRYRRHYFMANGIHAQAVAGRIPGARQRRAKPCRPRCFANPRLLVRPSRPPYSERTRLALRQGQSGRCSRSRAAAECGPASAGMRRSKPTYRNAAIL